MKENAMDQDAFAAQQTANGYTEAEVKTYEPRPVNGEHGHHFSVHGLIIAGEFTVTKEGLPTTYLAGDTFAVAEGCLHFEAVGPDGVTLVVGRKY